MKNVLTVAGIILFINGAFLSVLSNINVGIILTLLLGVFFAAWGIFYKQIKNLTKKGFLRVLKYFVIFALCIEGLLVGFIAIYGQSDNISYNEEAVIILGAGIRGDKVTMSLKLRLDKGVEYHRKNPDALIVVSGGQGFQETVTEAYAMEKYLLENGVAKDKIIKEEKATSTNENMRFSKAMLDERLGDEYNVTVITNNFHIYRATSIAKIEGIEKVTHLNASLQWYNMVPCYLRESLAVLKMWVFG